VIVTLPGRSTPKTLVTKHQLLEAKLRQIDEEIQHEEEAFAGIEARVRLLENAGRQAA